MDLGQVNAAGESTTVKTYDFTIESPSSDIVYFRLNEVDNDGYENNSQTIYSYCETSGNNNVIVQETGYKIQLEDVKFRGNFKFDIYDITGKLVQRFNKQLNSGFNQVEISQFSTGILMLNVMNDRGENYVFKLPPNH